MDIVQSGPIVLMLLFSGSRRVYLAKNDKIAQDHFKQYLPIYSSTLQAKLIQPDGCLFQLIRLFGPCLEVTQRD